MTSIDIGCCGVLRSFLEVEKMLLERFKSAYNNGDVSLFSNTELACYIRYLRLLGRIAASDYRCVCCEGTRLESVGDILPCKSEKCRVMRELFCAVDENYDEFTEMVKKESI